MVIEQMLLYSTCTILPFVGELVIDVAKDKMRDVIDDFIKSGAKNSIKNKNESDNISEFWEKSLSEKNQPGQTVVMNSVLSVYAPFLIGAPPAKRELHRNYRRSIPKTDFKDKKTTIDACLAYTAGQMVWRIDVPESKYVFLGLYHSIVRNSIPVFVEKNYYADKVEKLFSNRCNSAFEACIKGKIGKSPNLFFSEFIKQNKMHDFIKPQSIVRNSDDNFAILIDGNHSFIKKRGRARYLGCRGIGW